MKIQDLVLDIRESIKTINHSSERTAACFEKLTEIMNKLEHTVDTNFSKSQAEHDNFNKTLDRSTKLSLTLIKVIATAFTILSGIYGIKIIYP